MRSIHVPLATLVLSLALLGPRSADANPGYVYDKVTWPLALVHRPLVLAPYMFELRGDTVDVNLSSGAIGDPIALAPDIYFGIDQKLTVGIDHTVGFCVSQDCGQLYKDVALKGVYSLLANPYLDIAGSGGLVFPYFDPFAVGVQVGLHAKLRLATLALQVGGEIYLGAIGRKDDATLYPRSKEYLSVPVELQFQMQPQTAFVLSSGFYGRAGSDLATPLGIGVLYGISTYLDIGAEFALTNLNNPAGPTDGRKLIGRFALRL